jgi:hypothetical protein
MHVTVRDDVPVTDATIDLCVRQLELHSLLCRASACTQSMVRPWAASDP